MSATERLDRVKAKCVQGQQSYAIPLVNMRAYMPVLALLGALSLIECLLVHAWMVHADVKTWVHLAWANMEVLTVLWIAFDTRRLASASMRFEPDGIHIHYGLRFRRTIAWDECEDLLVGSELEVPDRLQVTPWTKQEHKLIFLVPMGDEPNLELRVRHKDAVQRLFLTVPQLQNLPFMIEG